MKIKFIEIEIEIEVEMKRKKILLLSKKSLRYPHHHIDIRLKDLINRMD